MYVVIRDTGACEPYELASFPDIVAALEYALSYGDPDVRVVLSCD